MDGQAPPAAATGAVLVQSEPMPDDTPQIKGYDFNNGVDFDAMMHAMSTTGFQATNFGKAIEEINRMLAWRLSHVPVREEEDDDLKASQDPAVRARVRCRIFLAYTSNLVSSGLRESLRFLAQHAMVDVITTTAGGVEEDLIKCMAPTFHGLCWFTMQGRDLRLKGINRIGNMLVPNENYCKFEDWIVPILNKMTDEQVNDGVRWTPSRMIHRFGKEINHPDSICYWAYKNNIPVFCPAITDGSIGDMIYFHMYKRPEFVVDIAADIKRINDLAVRAPATGQVILGGGLVKHHTCNANLMRNGADFSVYVNTAQEFDGSDAGARPDEAVSWGKIRLDARPVKVQWE
ncbi:unnamed protein product, partial [Heterosigma akashiwo]